MITEKAFFDAEILMGIHSDNPAYYNLMSNVADIIMQYNPKQVIEIGAGMGTLGQCLIKREINYFGIEPNLYHREYALQRGVNLNWDKELPDADFIVSIEVFEHLTDEQIDEYFKKLNGKYFLFSSTPNKTEGDESWGHINIKSQQEWVILFEKYGFVLNKKLSTPTEWALLFNKTNL